ncbi:MAG: ComEC family competence protein [Bacteroidaceae bacterium]|nr:ComEC family competence protein [Bacteroidaceae bacterium]
MNPFEQILSDAKALRFAIPFIIGIALSWCFRDVTHEYWYFPGFLCAIFCLVMFVVGRHRMRFDSVSFGVLAMLFFFFLGSALLMRSYHQTVVQWPAQRQCFQGIVTSSLRMKGKTNVFDVQLLAIGNGKKLKKISRHIQVTMLAERITPPTVGDALLLYGVISAPKNNDNPMSFDYASWLHRKGVSGTVYVGTNVRKCSAEAHRQLYQRLSWWQRINIQAQKSRQALLSRYASIDRTSREYAVVAALTLGDKYSLTRDIRTLFSETGASHVLALSGLHLGILVSVLLFLLRPFMRKSSTRKGVVAACIMFIWLFAWMTGLSVSLVRAAIMYTLALLFYLRNVQGIPINHLAIAALVILFFQPMALMDISFQLSFLSVFAILFFQPMYASIRPQDRRWAWTADFVYVAVAAQIATAPLVAYSFHIVPLTFLLSNVIVIPCSYLLLGGSLCLFVLSSVPLVSQWLCHAMMHIARWMLAYLEKIDALPLSFVEAYPSWVTVVLCYCLTISCVMLWYRRSRNAVAEIMIVFALLAGSIIYQHRPGKISNQVICYDIPSCPAVHFIASEGESALWMADSTQYNRVCAVAKTFWGSYQIDEPRVFTKDYAGPHIHSQRGIVTFNGKRYVLVSDDEWDKKTVDKPLAVEMLYITAKNRWQQEKLTQLFRPHEIIVR